MQPIHLPASIIDDYDNQALSLSEIGADLADMSLRDPHPIVMEEELDDYAELPNEEAAMNILGGRLSLSGAATFLSRPVGQLLQPSSKKISFRLLATSFRSEAPTPSAPSTHVSHTHTTTTPDAFLTPATDTTPAIPNASPTTVMAKMVFEIDLMTNKKIYGFSLRLVFAPENPQNVQSMSVVNINPSNTQHLVWSEEQQHFEAATTDERADQASSLSSEKDSDWSSRKIITFRAFVADEARRVVQVSMSNRGGAHAPTTYMFGVTINYDDKATPPNTPSPIHVSVSELFVQETKYKIHIPGFPMKRLKDEMNLINSASNEEWVDELEEKELGLKYAINFSYLSQRFR